MTASPVEPTFTADPGLFLDQAAPLLAAEPTLTSVVATVTRRLVGAAAPGAGAAPRWWALLRRDGELVGAAMRTMPAAPYAAYVLPMPEDAALALARALHRRGEAVPAVNGALPAARLVAQELGRLGHREVRETERHTLHELGTLRPPRPTTGALRPVLVVEAELARSWLDAFVVDADRQAGRVPEDREPHRLEDVVPRVSAGELWWWESGGRPVHLTGASAPAGGVVRIGPVYTPPESRGRGYASAAVHGVSARRRAEGFRVCLFTDQANPVSPRIYADLGFEPYAETASFRLHRR